MPGSLVIKLLLVLYLTGSLARTGYQVRRPVWTPRSWWRFGIALTISFALVAASMAMAIGVDNGIYKGMTPFEHRAYFYTLMTLGLVSPIATMGLLLWFAKGRPDRQL